MDKTIRTSAIDRQADSYLYYVVVIIIIIIVKLIKLPGSSFFALFLVGLNGKRLRKQSKATKGRKLTCWITLKWYHYRNICNCLFLRAHEHALEVMMASEKQNVQRTIIFCPSIHESWRDGTLYCRILPAQSATPCGIDTQIHTCILIQATRANKIKPQHQQQTAR